ncbi:MAG: GNAT family N-acyltransferase [Sporomusaceae bacterium]|nr:GNAT family N-acyltransferase [Sporomusaceae bacterium]
MNKTVHTTKIEHKSAEFQSFTVTIATNAADKKEIYAFRYQVYVEEMSKQLKSHTQELLYDAMDDWSLLVCVKAGNEIVGTARVNIGPIQKFPEELVEQLELKRFQKFYEGKEYQNFALSTKVVVAPEYRNSQVLYLVIAKAYELYCEYRVQFSFGGCNMYLLRLYEEVGLHRFSRNFIDPGYGLITPIVWLVDDVDHMRGLHSPFYRQARKRTGLNQEVRSWFFSEFPETRKFINSQLVSEEELWTELGRRLGGSPLQIPLLDGLSEDAAKKFLHKCGLVAPCHSGDQIITQGDPSNELNILLNGSLETTGPSAVTPAAILPGQHFGAAGLEESCRQTNSIFAAAPAEIIVLSRIAFPKFRHRYPDIAGRVLQNLDRLNNGEGSK